MGFTLVALFGLVFLVMSVVIKWQFIKLKRQVFESETRFQKAIEITGDISFTRNVESNVITWSPSIETRYKYCLPNHTSNFEWWVNCIHPDDRNRILSLLKERANSGQSSLKVEFRFKKADGDYAHVISRVFLIRDQKGNLIRTAGSLSDVTHLYQAIQSRDEMLAIISHELKTPLTTIATGIELMDKLLASREVGSEKEKEKVNQILHTLKSTVPRMKRLVTDLLDIAQIEARAFKLKLGSNSIYSIVNEAVETLSPTANLKDIKIECQIETGLSQIQCDRGRLVQVLINLIGNSIKFVSIGGKIILKVKQTHAYTRIQISDNGPGIAKENLIEVFDRFSRVRSTTHEGNGLGLAISKGIIESHGGQIWVESELGVGTQFTFDLPMAFEKSSQVA